MINILVSLKEIPFKEPDLPAGGFFYDHEQSIISVRMSDMSSTTTSSLAGLKIMEGGF
ncbi:MAG: hypothetical protein ABH833_03750 [Parcubacteria group bacterium]